MSSGRRNRGRILRRGASAGAVLIVGLVVLLVVTLIGVSGIQTSVLQDRMAGNLRQDQLALQAAEAALQAGLSYVEGLTSPPAAGITAHVSASCTPAGGSACGRWDSVLANWRGAADAVNEGTTYADIVAELGETGQLSGVAYQPRVYIESRYLPPLDAEAAARGVGIYYFDVMAVGFGADDNVRAILQSTIPHIYRWE